MGDVTHLDTRRCREMSARFHKAHERLCRTLTDLKSAGILTAKEADAIQAAIEEEFTTLQKPNSP